ncbi:hypothetical protein AGOR_G00163990 [Albula goreensis]|uniref:Circadian-associated transcriptional repressor-like n=1 Tax=Albula goreensis TaxID=1534307 RepID=A0A8T3D1I9_9TELE|nr:hypothetical protein AGOR_G00163990 [Albula goreensis]
MTASDSDCSIDWLASDDEDSGESVAGGDRGEDSDCGRRPSPGAGSTSLSPQPSGGSRGGQAQESEGGSDDSNEAGAWDRLAGKQEPQVPSAWRPSPCTVGQKRPRCQGPLEHRGRQEKDGEVERDKLFAHKCRELQCYVHPLASILNGLQSGRYRERLSSFQESVAMDRIRRILGVLQNPCAGERYINIILKVEVMLKTWFPNVKPGDQEAGDHAQEATPSKRQKVSPVTTALPVSASVPASLSGQLASEEGQRAGEAARPGMHSATSLKWLHTSPICSPTVEPGASLRQRATPGGRGVTQDNSVSSSTDPAPTTPTPPKPPKPAPPSRLPHPRPRAGRPPAKSAPPVWRGC